MKKIFVLSTISISLAGFAQTVGNSPYSGYGIGDVKYDNTVEHAGMGGITAAYIPDFNASFNFQNPAANTNFTLSTLKFEVSNESNFYTTRVDNYSGKKHSNYVSNIVFAFPLSKKAKFGLGYQPYSSKNYNIADKNEIIDYHYQGKGTLNTIQAAVSYQITPKLSVGLRSNFYFGVLTDLNELKDTNAQYTVGRQTTSKIKNTNFTIGTTYQHTNEDDKKITVGATATFGNIGSSSIVDYYKSTYLYNSYGEKINESVIDQKTYDGKDNFPFQATLGLGYGRNMKWFVGTQMDYKQGYDTYFEGNAFKMNNAMRFGVGGWVLPNINNFRNYFQRVTYRFGAYYEKSGLAINDTNVNSVGLSFGASLPFKNSSVNRINGVDIAVELGKRGTIQNNLINQNFINLKIGFNFSDKWFIKAVYN